MSDYLKIFDTAVELLAYHNDEPTTPVVSLSVDLEEVMYTHNYEEMYFTIEPLYADGNVSITVPSDLVENNIITYLSYRIDKGSWNSLDISNSSILIPLTVGHNVLLKGNYLGAGYDYDPLKITYTSEGKSNFNAYGNIMSLCYGDNFIEGDANILIIDYLFYMLFSESSITDASNLILPLNPLIGEGCYMEMFEDCSNLIKAPKLPATTLSPHCYNGMFYYCVNLVTPPELPATTLTEGCYQGMFGYCTNLIVTPVLPALTLVSKCYTAMFRECRSLTTILNLPATTLTEICYLQMFYNCESLVNVPATLPATTLASSCYSNMFYGCRSLTTAPALPATALVSNCYFSMFYGCTSLNYIKCLATSLGAKSTQNWLTGVSSTGTFVKAASMTDWPSGNSGIPTNWTVQNAS